MVVKGHSAQKSPNFAHIITKQNHIEGAALELSPGLARLGPCKAMLTSNSTFFKLNFASKIYNVL
jgi:hypothetical protein